MSIAATTWAWSQALPAGQKLVLLDLADRHNGKTGLCVAKVATIAGRTGECCRTVQRHLQDLMHRGLIAIQSRHKRAHRFVLRLPEAAKAEVEEAPVAPAAETPIRDTVSRTAPGFATQCHPEPEEERFQPEGEEEGARADARDAPTSPPLRISLSPRKGEPSRRPAARGTPLPDDWLPSAEDRAYARGRGLDPGGLLALFVDHHRAHGSYRADWSAAWRVWCAHEPGWRQRRAVKPLTGAQVLAHNWEQTKARLAAKGIAL